MSARAVEAALAGFIAGVAVTAVVMWLARERIKARMTRRRRDR
jgi:hypothetical protein